MSAGNYYSEHLYQHSSMNTEDLQKNVQEYPFSSLANFLLLFHYKKIRHPEFETFAKKVALHFRNARWLQFVLYQKKDEKDSGIEAENKIGQQVDKPLEIASNQPIEIYTAQNIVDHIDDKTVIGETKEEPISEADVNVIQAKVEQPVLEITKSEAIQFENENLELPKETVEPPLFRKLSFDNNAVNEAENVIAFDPLHTVDYFASQGIKLNEEEVKNDKLGNQMKSFTAWLKSMKRLHATVPEEHNSGSESLIKTSAEESNINTEILTEAMAEVLIKQDKKEKAIDMFNKLSLINPAKSAYFAAKIESIKLR